MNATNSLRQPQATSGGHPWLTPALVAPEGADQTGVAVFS